MPKSRFKSSHFLFASVAVSGAIAMGDYSEAGFIVFLFSIAEWLNTRASRKVCLSLSDRLLA
jgi:cation transport ATPase